MLPTSSFWRDVYKRQELNRLGTLSPLAYKKYYGLPHAKKGYTDRKDCRWSANTVTRILQDETYTGTLVQGRKGSQHFKLKEMESRPSSEWIRVENAHEAIIDRNDFDLVQRIRNLDTRTSPQKDKVYLFSGIPVSYTHLSSRTPPLILPISLCSEAKMQPIGKLSAPAPGVAALSMRGRKASSVKMKPCLLYTSRYSACFGVP